MRQRLGLIASFVLPLMASAHEDLSTLVHHAATFCIDETNIDVTVTLTFYGNLAMAQRARMDRDDDGAISDRERASFIMLVKNETADAAQLYADESLLNTVPLYDPIVDLQGAWHHSDAPLTITLSYFARRAPNNDREFEIALADTLWQDAAAICTTRVDPRAHNRLIASAPARTRSGEAHRHAVSFAEHRETKDTRKGEP